MRVFSVNSGPAKAFDHIKLIQQALKRVLAKQVVNLHRFFDTGQIYQSYELHVSHPVIALTKPATVAYSGALLDCQTLSPPE
jgi:thymidylate kinase